MTQALVPQTATDIAWFSACLHNQELVATLKNISLIISDVDGTLTGGHIYIDDEKEGGRLFSIVDGYIVKNVQQAGLALALMSGKGNSSTIVRGKKLGIPEELCIVGMLKKPAAVQELQQKLSIRPEQTLFIGDDVLDAEVKLANKKTVFACPANAPFYIQKTADIIIPRNGDNHAFRLLMDLVLFIQNKHIAQDLITHALAS